MRCQCFNSIKIKLFCQKISNQYIFYIESVKIPLNKGIENDNLLISMMNWFEVNPLGFTYKHDKSLYVNYILAWGL